jgi:hypothetical protein
MMSLSCVRERTNFSSIGTADRFDKKSFKPEEFLEKLPINSPKMIALLQKIQELDAKDYNKEKKLYKHFIFSDASRGYGAKIIASAMVASGYTLVLKPKGNKIILDESLLNKQDEAKFALLSSTVIWDKKSTQSTTKEILKEFNIRPGNVYGDRIRFIILDSGFREGIDLFDVKYGHIFEEQTNDAAATQAVGRGVRYCGQSGLPFKNGWKLFVYEYTIYTLKHGILLNTRESIINNIKKQNTDLQYNINLGRNLTKIIQESAVDRLLIPQNTTHDIVKTVVLVSGILGTAGAINTIHNRIKPRKS